jgi:hypothetical protein
MSISISHANIELRRIRYLQAQQGLLWCSKLLTERIIESREKCDHVTAYLNFLGESIALDGTLVDRLGLQSSQITTDSDAYQQIWI